MITFEQQAITLPPEMLYNHQLLINNEIILKLPQKPSVWHSSEFINMAFQCCQSEGMHDDNH